jgi:hypothetical protein
MLQLRRIRLESVGHPNARFAPLELRLTDGDGRPTHSVLWLRNGGGKSSLLNLVFAVVRPNRREFLGSNEDGKDRRLADYVLAGDTSHVCIEWGEPGARTPSLVTGMSLEWRDRLRSSDESRLRRLWYAFVPSDHMPPGLLEFDPTLTFDTLPITEDDRRLSLARFRERLRAVAAGDSSLRLVTPTSQAEWRRELEQHDLDPEVLRYQLQMNREEGGASDLFKRRCRTESDFVDLLLELAVADEQSDRVADVYTRYADELARRPDVERNRAFLAGALERLDPVLDASRQRQEAQLALDTVLGDVAAMTNGLRRAAADAQAQVSDQEARSRSLEEAARRHDDAAREQRARAVGVRRRAAELDVADTERRLEQATTELADVDARLAAVALLEPLARSMQLGAEIATIDRRLEADQPEIAQDLLHAQGLLHRRLVSDEGEQRAAAQEAQRLAHERNAEADATEREAQRLVGERGRVEQARTTLAERGEARRRRQQALVVRGALDRGEDPRAAHERLRTQLRAAQQQQSDRDRELARLDAELREGYAQVARIDDAHVEARGRLSDRVHAREQIVEAAAALAADERLHDLAETTDIDIWDAGPMLVDRLDQLVDDADRRLADDAVAEAADRAGLAGLQTDGLLPARRDVQHVVEMLERAGITASSGWRHLAERVSAEQRAALIAQLPAIVDGVVVADERRLAQAGEIVANMADPLSTIVVVAAAPDNAEHPPAGSVTAPVDPALYDRARAEDARIRLRGRLQDADRRRAAVVSGRARDAALADRLRRLLSSHPADQRTAIDEAVEQASVACGRLRAERDTLHERLEQLHERRTALAGAQADAPQQLGELTSLLSGVELLLSEMAEADDGDDLLRRAQEIQQQATAATARAQELRRAAADHNLTAQRHREQADRLRDRRVDLAAPEGGDDGDPDETLEVLEQRVQTLSMQVDAAVAGSTLGERRRLLIERRSELEHEIARADDTTAALARDLLRGPQGHAREARATLLRDSERARDAALSARAEAAERVRAARASRDRLPDVAFEGTPPETADAAKALERELIAAAEQATAAAAASRADAERTRDGARDHARHGDRFGHLAELLAVELRGRADAGDDTTSVSDVPADPEQARAAAEALRARLAERVDDAERTSRALSQCAAEVRRFVTDARFAALDGPIRARLSADPVAVVHDDGALLEQLSMRLQQCEQKLDELRQHRRLLVREIAANVQRGLWLLRQADQVSSLPAGFGDWSEQRFLHIRFATPAVDDELVERLEAMVDQLVDEGVRPSGVPLLQRATHAAVGSAGFGVRILKPNPALRPDRVPVTELATFSGGEQLTAAILLYCTLARLRAQARQAQSTAGVLTLDNPIGKSSNVTLLRLQRRVADAMGVQLVYTTAVDDREAVGVLPHWIRLRNERSDARTGNQHVEIIEEDGDDDEQVAHTNVSATHMWRRNDNGAAAVSDLL